MCVCMPIFLNITYSVYFYIYVCVCVYKYIFSSVCIITLVYMYVYRCVCICINIYNHSNSIMSLACVCVYITLTQSLFSLYNIIYLCVCFQAIFLTCGLFVAKKWLWVYSLKVSLNYCKDIKNQLR